MRRYEQWRKRGEREGEEGGKEMRKRKGWNAVEEEEKGEQSRRGRTKRREERRK